MIIPDWFRNHRFEVEGRLASLKPFPFSQPADDTGFLFSIFLFPAVPKDTSIARFSIYSELTETDIEYIAEQTHAAMKKFGIESKFPKK